MKISLLLLSAASFAHSAILANYDFETTGGGIYADKALASGVSASDFNRGTAILLDNGISTNTPPGGGSGSFFARGDALASGESGSESGFNAAQTNGSFVSFTVTAEAGTTFSLTSFNFDLAKWGGEPNYLRAFVTADVTGDNFADRLTITGDGAFANVLESNNGEIGNINGTGGSWGASQDLNVDVTGAAFQNLTSVTFNIYLYSLTQTTDGGNTNNLYLDNLTLQGNVIPEPSTAAFALLGAAALLRRRR